MVKRLTRGVHEQQSSSGRTVVVGCDGAAMRPAGSGADATGATAEAASLPPVTVAGMSRLQTPADQGCRHAEMRMGTRADGRGGGQQGRAACLASARPVSASSLLLAVRPASEAWGSSGDAERGGLVLPAGVGCALSDSACWIPTARASRSAIPSGSEVQSRSPVIAARAVPPQYRNQLRLRQAIPPSWRAY